MKECDAGDVRGSCRLREARGREADAWNEECSGTLRYLWKDRRRRLGTMNGLRSASLAKVLLVSLVLLAAGMLAGGVLPGVGTAWADTAGYNAPGFTNYSNLAPIVTGSTALKFGLDWARASTIDPAS